MFVPIRVYFLCCKYCMEVLTENASPPQPKTRDDWVFYDSRSLSNHLISPQLAHSEVNLNQISSVILHSERSLEKTNKGDRLPPSSCAGVWFTINGPRVGWGRSLRKITDPETQKSSDLVEEFEQPLN